MYNTFQSTMHCLSLACESRSPSSGRAPISRDVSQINVPADLVALDTDTVRSMSVDQLIDLNDRIDQILMSELHIADVSACEDQSQPDHFIVHSVYYPPTSSDETKSEVQMKQSWAQFSAKNPVAQLNVCPPRNPPNLNRWGSRHYCRPVAPVFDHTGGFKYDQLWDTLVKPMSKKTVAHRTARRSERASKRVLASRKLISAAANRSSQVKAVSSVHTPGPLHVIVRDTSCKAPRQGDVVHSVSVPEYDYLENKWKSIIAEQRVIDVAAAGRALFSYKESRRSMIRQAARDAKNAFRYEECSPGVNAAVVGAAALGVTFLSAPAAIAGASLAALYFGAKLAWLSEKNIGFGITPRTVFKSVVKKIAPDYLPMAKNLFGNDDPGVSSLGNLLLRGANLFADAFMAARKWLDDTRVQMGYTEGQMYLAGLVLSYVIYVLTDSTLAAVVMGVCALQAVLTFSMSDVTRLVTCLTDHLSNLYNRLRKDTTSDKKESYVPCSLATGIVELLTLGVTAFSGTMATKAKGLDGLMSSISKYTSFKKGMGDLSETISDWCSWLLALFKQHLLSDTDAIKRYYSDPLTSDFTDASNSFIDGFKGKKFDTINAENDGRVSHLILVGDALVSTKRFTKLVNSIQQNVFSLLRTLREIKTQFCSIDNQALTRQEPVMVYLCSPPGWGKSTIAQLLPTALLATLFPTVTAEDVHRSYGSFVFPRYQSNCYWDGYMGQWILSRDDVGAVDPKVAESSESAEMMDDVGTMPYHLHMAAMDGKIGRMAKWRIIICSSNVMAPPATDLLTPGALYRRLHLCFKTRVVAKYALPDGKVNSALAVTLPPDQAWRIYEFLQYRITTTSKTSSSTTAQTHDVGTTWFGFDRLVELIAAQDTLHGQAHKSISPMNDCVFKYFRDKIPGPIPAPAPVKIEPIVPTSGNVPLGIVDPSSSLIAKPEQDSTFRNLVTVQDVYGTRFVAPTFKDEYGGIFAKTRDWAKRWTFTSPNISVDQDYRHCDVLCCDDNHVKSQEDFSGFNVNKHASCTFSALAQHGLLVSPRSVKSFIPADYAVAALAELGLARQWKPFLPSPSMTPHGLGVYSFAYFVSETDTAHRYAALKKYDPLVFDHVNLDLLREGPRVVIRRFLTLSPGLRKTALWHLRNDVSIMAVLDDVKSGALDPVAKTIGDLEYVRCSLDPGIPGDEIISLVSSCVFLVLIGSLSYYWLRKSEAVEETSARKEPITSLAARKAAVAPRLSAGRFIETAGTVDGLKSFCESVCELYVADRLMGRCFAIGGKFFVTARHVIRRILESGVDTISLYSPTRDVEYEIFTTDLQKCYVMQQTDPRDTIVFAKVTGYMAPFPRKYSHIPATPYHPESNRLMTALPRVIPLGFEVHHAPANLVHDDRFGQVYTTGYSSVPGDSGTPFFASINGRFMFVGVLHGTNSSSSLCCTVDRDSIVKVVDDMSLLFDIVDPVPVSTLDPAIPATYMECAGEGGPMIRHFMPLQLAEVLPPIPINVRTGLVRTHISRYLPYPGVYAPSYMRWYVSEEDGVPVLKHPLFASNTYPNKAYAFPSSVVDICVGSILDRLDEYHKLSLKPSDLQTDFLRVLTFEEAILGWSDGVLGPLSRRTSPGFPMVIDKEIMAAGGRKYFFGKGDTYDLTRPQCVTLKADCLALLAQINRGDIPHQYNVVFMKDELRKIAKVQAHDTRVVECAPLCMLIVMKMLWGCLATRFMQANVFVGCAAGANVMGRDYSNFIDDLSRQPVIFDGDIRGYDHNMLADIFVRQHHVCSRRYADEYHMARMVTGVWYAYSKRAFPMPPPPRDGTPERALYDTHWRAMFGHTMVVQAVSGMSSGMYLTWLMNYMQTTVHIMCVYLRIRPDLSKFWEEVTLCVMGDDHVVGSRITELNAVVMRDHLATYDIKYTTAAKLPVTEPTTPFSEVEFLKRTFKFIPLLSRWVAPLSVDSIYRCLHWTSTADQAVFVNTVRDALSEASLHGPEFYDQLVSEVVAAYKTVYPSTDLKLHAWGPCIARVLNEVKTY